MGEFWLIKDKMELKQRIESFHKYLATQWDWEHPVAWKVSIYRPRRSMSQNDLFHLWVREAVVFLKEKNPGAKDLTEEDLKELLKFRYLGTEDKTVGTTVIPAQVRKTRKLDAGEMFDFMEQVHEWALDLGIKLTHPQDSEYMKLQQR